jgi:hypothetical protein
MEMFRNFNFEIKNSEKRRVVPLKFRGSIYISVEDIKLGSSLIY